MFADHLGTVVLELEQSDEVSRFSLISPRSQEHAFTHDRTKADDTNSEAARASGAGSSQSGNLFCECDR